MGLIFNRLELIQMFIRRERGDPTVVCSGVQLLEAWVWEKTSGRKHGDLHSETRESRRSLDCCFKGENGYVDTRATVRACWCQKNSQRINQKLVKMVLYRERGGGQWTSLDHSILILHCHWDIYWGRKDLSLLKMVSWLISKNCLKIITIIKSMFRIKQFRNEIILLEPNNLKYHIETLNDFSFWITNSSWLCPTKKA